MGVGDVGEGAHVRGVGGGGVILVGGDLGVCLEVGKNETDWQEDHISYKQQALQDKKLTCNK